jgi:uncharacterized membrane protein
MDASNNTYVSSVDTADVTTSKYPTTYVVVTARSRAESCSQLYDVVFVGIGFRKL